MQTKFSEHAWEDFCHWLDTDKKMTKRIRALVKDIHRSPFVGIGKPERLKENLAGYWSRRIDGEHRLVYRIEDSTLEIAQCRGHY